MKKNTVFIYLFFLFIARITDAQVPLLYGLTSSGGNYGNGTIVSINADGSGFDTLYSFDKFLGYQPQGSLLNVSNDSLYGMTYLGGQIEDVGVIFSFNPATNTYRDVHDFNDTAGSNPQGNLIRASNGKLYGLTSAGGGKSFGVLFSFDPATHAFNDLHNFSGSGGNDGQNPTGSLTQVDNKLYGLTSAGGSHTYGVIFNYNLSTNAYKKLYDLGGGISNGSLVNAHNGKFYGLTSSGGNYGSGEIFSFDTTSSTYTDVYDFDGASNGGAPHGSLILANNGNLYGMTELGGNNSSGIIFSLNPNGNVFNKLYDFDGVTGIQPNGSLLQGSSNFLYGMTSGGINEAGNIFSFSLNGNVYTDLTQFNDTLGAEPFGDLIELPAFAGITKLKVANENVLIYPNPSSGKITIDCDKNIDEIKIYNLIGQLVYTGYPGQAKCSITLKQEGVYFITTTSNNQTTTQKIFISE